MNLKKIFFDYKNNLGMVWLWLGIVILAFDFLFVGYSRWEFIYGINYAIGFIAVGILLGSDKPKPLSGIFALFMGLLVVWFEASGGTSMDINLVAGINIMLFLGILAVEQGWLNFGSKIAPYAKYTTVISFAAWFLWPLAYFWTRITTGLPLTINTDLYHGGIMLLAGLDLFTFAGTAFDFKWYKNLRLILLLVSILGAYLVAGVAGWGLRLI